MACKYSFPARRDFSLLCSVNPKGLLSAGVGVIFIAAVPLTSFLTQPGGLVEKAVYGSMRTLAWAGTAGATSAISQKSMIPALSALYIAMTYALTGAASAAGVGSAYKEGRDNKRTSGASQPCDPNI